jgi:hypothetical protein
MTTQIHDGLGAQGTGLAARMTPTGDPVPEVPEVKKAGPRIPSVAEVEALRESTAGVRASLKDQLVKSDVERLEALMGRELAYNPEELLLRGRIRKSNLEIAAGIVVDMVSLTAEERLVCRKLVPIEGLVTADSIAKEDWSMLATMAWSVVRLNGKDFRIPNAKDGDQRGEAALKAAYDGKQELFDLIKRMDPMGLEQLGIAYIYISDEASKAFEGSELKK